MKCRLCLLTSAAAGTPAIFIIYLCPPKYEDVSNLKMEITQNQFTHSYKNTDDTQNKNRLILHQKCIGNNIKILISNKLLKGLINFENM